MGAVRAYTGIQADFFVVLDYASIESLFDIMGDLEFDVPQDMLHQPRPYDYFDLDAAQRAALRPEINLRRGRQMLNGGQVVQLLRFRNYGGGYRNEEISRINMHINVMREVFRQKLVLENLEIARDIYDAVIRSIVATNMGLDDFENHAHLIFGLGEYEFRIIEYPGMRRYENGVEFFIPLPNRSEAVEIFRDFRREPTPFRPAPESEPESGTGTGTETEER
jgi:anionic cell wall polymer biosynthesis LytR-Cps2A-Psr (LCP) family protein